MKNGKIISVIQTDSPHNINALLNGLSVLYSHLNKNSIIIDMRSVNGNILWSHYGKKEIKYLDDILNVVLDINVPMLKTYLNLREEILCVKNLNNCLLKDNFCFLLRRLSEIYDNVFAVYLDKSLNKDFIYVSDIILLPFIEDPVSMDNCKTLYSSLLSGRNKNTAVFPVKFKTDIEVNFNDENLKIFSDNIISLPFNFEIQREILNNNFMFNDKSNEFVIEVQKLINELSTIGSTSGDEKESFYERQDKYNLLKDKLHKDLVVKMKEYSKEKDKNVLADIIKLQMQELLKSYNITLQFQTQNKLLKELVDDIAGLGVLEDLLSDENISEIMVNGIEKIYIERNGKLEQTDLKFYDVDRLKTVIDMIVSSVGRHIDEASPIVDARLKDGSRVNAVIPPVSLNGPVLTIRKFSKHKLSGQDLINYGSINAEMLDFLKNAVNGKKNILISGGTGTGKTTLLNIMSSFISERERIVTIEDSAELQLQQQHVIRLESRAKSLEGTSEIPIRQLVVNSLRMRPDRIIVGECRSGETLDMLQAMNTGHDGSMTTVHSNSCNDAISRLLVMSLMSGVELPEKSIISMIVSAINIIVQIKRFPDGTRKISEISLLEKSEDKIYRLVPVFLYDVKNNIYIGADQRQN